MTAGVHTFASDKSAARIAQIKFLLRQKPMSTLELSMAMGFDRKTGRLYLDHLRPQIHVAGWGASVHGGRAPQLWAWGALPDVAPPPPRVPVAVAKPPKVRVAIPPNAAPSPRIRSLVERSRQVQRPAARRDWSVAMFFPL